MDNNKSNNENLLELMNHGQDFDYEYGDFEAAVANTHTSNAIDGEMEPKASSKTSGTEG